MNFTYDLEKMKQAVESERITIPKEALESFESFDNWISEEDISVKKDPNEYCVNYRQNLKWALIHDIVAHPLMAVTLYKCDLFIKFHDYTSSKAWERTMEENITHVSINNNSSDKSIDEQITNVIQSHKNGLTTRYEDY